MIDSDKHKYVSNSSRPIVCCSDRLIEGYLIHEHVEDTPLTTPIASPRVDRFLTAAHGEPLQWGHPSLAADLLVRVITHRVT